MGRECVERARYREEIEACDRGGFSLIVTQVRVAFGMGWCLEMLCLDYQVGRVWLWILRGGGEDAYLYNNIS